MSTPAPTTNSAAQLTVSMTFPGDHPATPFLRTLSPEDQSAFLVLMLRWMHWAQTLAATPPRPTADCLDAPQGGALRGPASSGEAPLCRIERPSLTSSELDVLRIIRLGQADDAIAEQLGIKKATVQFHVETLLRKFGAPNKTVLAVLSTSLGFV